MSDIPDTREQFHRAAGGDHDRQVLWRRPLHARMTPVPLIVALMRGISGWTTAFRVMWFNARPEKSASPYLILYVVNSLGRRFGVRGSSAGGR